MSGPLKFWLGVVVVLVVGGLVVYRLTGRDRAPEAARSPEVSASSGAPATMQQKMAAWVDAYRASFDPVGSALVAFEATAAPAARECNALITAGYNAANELPTAQDPDVDKYARQAAESFAAAGKSCARGDHVDQDVRIVVARSWLQLAEKLLEDRYGLSGVPQLAEPGEGSKIGQRAAEGIAATEKR